jgi:hypothetical protein
MPPPTSRSFGFSSGQAPKFRHHEPRDRVWTSAAVRPQITLRDLAIELFLRSAKSGAAEQAMQKSSGSWILHILRLISSEMMSVRGWDS